MNEVAGGGYLWAMRVKPNQQASSVQFLTVLPMLLVVFYAMCVPARAQVPAGANGELLAPERVAALPESERRAWAQYLAESRRWRDTDRASLQAELAALRQSGLTRAPKGPSLVIEERMTDAWFRSDEARRLADAVVSYQTPSGGWSKRVDLQKEVRRPGQGYASERDWHYVATFDNGATTEHLRFLSHAYRALGEARYRTAFLKGLEYVLRAQYPNGCWPQVYPLEGKYHDAATYNDDLMANVLQLLHDVATGKHAFVGAEYPRRAGASLQRGTKCVIATQVVADGRRSAWGAQYDPLTLRPIGARAYEHATLDAQESARIVEFLLSLESPGAPVVEAVHAAAAWLRAVAVQGYEYRDGELIAKEGAGPVWARFYEIGTNRPVFSNRDGVVRYRWSDLEAERRTGYAWYTRRPQSVLRKYAAWARQHPVKSLAGGAPEPAVPIP